MPRPPGTPKTGGRMAGTPNKRTIELKDRLHELKCDPIQGMVEIACAARKSGNHQLAGQMYKELAQYLYPKRKAVDITGDYDDEPVTAVTIEMVDASKKDRVLNEHES